MQQWGYAGTILALMLILPAVSVTAEMLAGGTAATPMDLIGKWFVFWAVGVRLLAAGLNQVRNPGFTVQKIFRIDHAQSHAFVRELGFANISLGVLGVVSSFASTLRPGAAVAGGLFLGLAGAYHAIKRPAGANEWVAMLTDLFAFGVLAGYLGWVVARSW